MQKNKTLKVAIIGAGASGVCAAISALLASKNSGLDVDVHLFDVGNRLGKSLLKTGNGRCNFCNRYIDADLYYNNDFVKRVLCANSSLVDENAISGYECSQWSKLTLGFLKKLGLMWREETDGRLYPYANKASSILDVIDRELSLYDNFNFHPDTDGIFAFNEFENVIVCTGKNAEILNILPVQHIISQTGILCPIEVEEKSVKKLDNIRAKVRVDLLRKGRLIASEVGEVLFRKYGVSGICIFNLSRYAHPGDALKINFLPDISNSEFKLIKSRLYNHDYINEPDVALAGIVLPEIARMACSNLTDFELTVSSLHTSDRQSQTVRGGIDISEVDEYLRLANVIDKNIYVAGEIIDVDGPCGGYNLNWAFASGIIAGKSAISNIINF